MVPDPRQFGAADDNQDALEGKPSVVEFEPDKPKNSVYMAPSSNCMGVLLQPSKRKKISPNPVMGSLNIVYTPSQDAASGDGLVLQDPGGLPVRFQSADEFTKVEKRTR